MVTLKRKKQWVKRYAIINNNIFTYKKSKTDKKEKQIIDLTSAKILLGESSKTAPYIYIQKDPFNPEAIRVRLDNQELFLKWLEMVQAGRKFGQVPYENKETEPLTGKQTKNMLSAINEQDEDES